MEIGQIAKTSKLTTKVRIVEFKGKTYVDARQFFMNDKTEWIPTKKGVMISVGQLSDFITLLEKAEASLKKGGTKNGN